MRASDNAARQLADQLAGLGPAWVYLYEYRITHAYLHITVRDKSFSRLADLYLTDCISICGPTSGGPWHLTATIIAGERDTEFEIATLDRLLVVRALRAECRIATADSAG